MLHAITYIGRRAANDGKDAVLLNIRVTIRPVVGYANFYTSLVRSSAQVTYFISGVKRNEKIYDSFCAVRGRSYYFITTFLGISCPKLLFFSIPVH